MGIKSVVHQSSNTDNQPAPRLKTAIVEGHQVVVLFIFADRGVVVASELPKYEVGKQFFKDMTQCQEFNGTVTLSNEP